MMPSEIHCIDASIVLPTIASDCLSNPDKIVDYLPVITFNPTRLAFSSHVTSKGEFSFR